MGNHKALPSLKYHLNPGHMHFGSIVAAGEVLHKVTDLDEFYRGFGYTAELRKAGVLPEEFMWEEYIKGERGVIFSTCMQVHMIEYLLLKSARFRQRYAEPAEKFVLAHAEEKLTLSVRCAACRIKEACEELDASKNP